MVVDLDEDREDLVALNRLGELLQQDRSDTVVKVSAIRRPIRRKRQQPQVLQKTIVQKVQIERIKQVRDVKRWIANLKTYLFGDETNSRQERPRQVL